MAKITNPWGDGRDADVLDGQCCARPCLHVGEDKGSYTQGRGYTSYYKNPKLVCMSRLLRGCPHPLPEADPEKVRCCDVPDFPKVGKGRRPRFQTCRTCKARASGWLLEQRKALPQGEHCDCRHSRVSSREDDLFRCTLWVCRDCGFYWKTHKPKPRSVGKSFRELLDEHHPTPGVG